MSDNGQLDRFASAYLPAFKFHQENILMESWYARRVVAGIRDKGLRSLISLGMGDTTLSQEVIRGLAGHVDAYTIVEGSAEIISRWRSQVDQPEFVHVEHALFEAYEPSAPVEAIEMGFILEHVDDPALVVDRYREFLAPGGALFVAVPNARSLHRLVGHEAGLLADMYALSEHDRELGHQRYFDRASVEQLLRDAQFEIARTEGIFLKPVTQSQLASLELGPEVMEALCQVAVDLPSIGNAIFVEAVR